MVQDALCSGKPETAQEDGSVLRLDAPRPIGDGAGGVDHRQVDLRAGRDAIEKRRPVRRRLGKDRRDADRSALAVRESAQPALGFAARRRGVAAVATTRQRPSGQARIQPQRSSGQTRTRSRSRMRRHARDVTGSLCAGACPVSSLEGGKQCEIRVGSCFGLAGIDRVGAADTPRQLDLAGRELGRERRDSPPRDPQLTLALELATPLRRLSGVHAVEDERVGQVVTVRHVEQARPQLVVLALLEARVVAEPVPLEEIPIDEHRRVEERRAEQRRPANGAGPGRHLM